MAAQTITKGKKLIASKGKVEYFFITVLIMILIAAIYFTSSDTGGKIPTGYASMTGLTLDETVQKANFEFAIPKEIPFSPTLEEGTIDITKYGKEEVHRVSLHYLNENTSEEVYFVFSSQEDALQEYETLAFEEIPLANGQKAKYGIKEYGEGLTWNKAGVSYGIYNHIHKGQPALGVDEMTKLAQSLGDK
jgi:hypothetical protein